MKVKQYDVCPSSFKIIVFIFFIFIFPGWGTRVYQWRIHVDVWQNQYNIVK